MKNNLQQLIKEIAHKHNWKVDHVSAIVYELFDEISKKLIEKEDLINTQRLIIIKLKEKLKKCKIDAEEVETVQKLFTL